jgi:hypothetical protein
MLKRNAEQAPAESWAIDLGTTNTVVARCVGGHASPVELADVCVEEPIEHTPMVPSQVYFDTPEHFHIGAGYTVDQIVHHDYAVRLFDHKAQRPEYELLVRRGTRYPAQAGDARYYTLTKGQTEFALPVCEVGLAGRMRIDWVERPNGHRYWTPGPVEEKECVYTLNEGDTLRISPPGVAGQHRLRVEFSVDAERYLCATVHDLKLKRDIRENARLVKLR